MKICFSKGEENIRKWKFWCGGGVDNVVSLFPGTITDSSVRGKDYYAGGY
ncbi:hypothetical protein [Xanthovirga aplysinae]|nr:hypothetical protein [Xanthovirga aplysinae]